MTSPSSAPGPSRTGWRPVPSRTVQRPAAPLYPLLSGAVAAAAHIGHAVPFPQRAAMGPHCTRSFHRHQRLVAADERHLPTRSSIGLVGWLVLLGGVVAVLRASGRGRRRWEPATLALVACLPPVWTCLESYVPSRGPLAVGLALGAVAPAPAGLVGRCRTPHRPRRAVPAVRDARRRAAPVLRGPAATPSRATPPRGSRRRGRRRCR